MTTVREALGRKMRRGTAIALVGFTLCLVQAIFVPTQNPPFLVFVGMAALFSAVMYLHFGIRCFQCRNRIGYIVAYGGSPFWISKRLRFCPYCGLELDATLASVKRAA
jgi:hypothetical protein